MLICIAQCPYRDLIQVAVEKSSRDLVQAAFAQSSRYLIQVVRGGWAGQTESTLYVTCAWVFEF